MTRLAVAAALSLVLLACPKAPPATTLGGTDEENVDRLSSQLEEFHTKTDLQCSDWCSLKSKVCDVSKSLCDVAGHHADRDDYQKKCIAGQEECARYNEDCSSCSKK